MATNVLVLNQDYTPLSICSSERAFLLVYLEKAEMLHAYEHEPMRSISHEFKRPSVIKINRYISVPYKGVHLTRQNIFKRDGFCCLYCGSTNDLTIDHILPKSRGGKTTWKNVATACSPCNASKGSKFLEDIEMTLSQTPFKPSPFFFLADKQGRLRNEWKNYF